MKSCQTQTVLPADREENQEGDKKTNVISIAEIHLLKKQDYVLDWFPCLLLSLLVLIIKSVGACNLEASVQAIQSLLLTCSEGRLCGSGEGVSHVLWESGAGAVLPLHGAGFS